MVKIRCIFFVFIAENMRLMNWFMFLLWKVRHRSPKRFGSQRFDYCNFRIERHFHKKSEKFRSHFLEDRFWIQKYWDNAKVRKDFLCCQTVLEQVWCSLKSFCYVLQDSYQLSCLFEFTFHANINVYFLTYLRVSLIIIFSYGLRKFLYQQIFVLRTPSRIQASQFRATLEPMLMPLTVNRYPIDVFSRLVCHWTQGKN